MKTIEETSAKKSNKYNNQYDKANAYNTFYIRSIQTDLTAALMYALGCSLVHFAMLIAI